MRSIEEDEAKAPKVILKPVISGVKSLKELLVEAIRKKEEKNHAGINTTVLVLDNRTSEFEIDHFLEIKESVSRSVVNSPFLRIFVYTGGFSDDDGKNSAFSLFPLK